MVGLKLIEDQVQDVVHLVERWRKGACWEDLVDKVVVGIRMVL